MASPCLLQPLYACPQKRPLAPLQAENHPSPTPTVSTYASSISPYQQPSYGPMVPYLEDLYSCSMFMPYHSDSVLPYSLLSTPDNDHASSLFMSTAYPLLPPSPQKDIFEDTYLPMDFLLKTHSKSVMLLSSTIYCKEHCTNTSTPNYSSSVTPTLLFTDLPEQCATYTYGIDTLPSHWYSQEQEQEQEQKQEQKQKQKQEQQQQQEQEQKQEQKQDQKQEQKQEQVHTHEQDQKQKQRQDQKKTQASLSFFHTLSPHFSPKVSYIPHIPPSSPLSPVAPSLLLDYIQQVTCPLTGNELHTRQTPLLPSSKPICTSHRHRISKPSQPLTPHSRLFACYTEGCDKVFKRSEHLKRHVRSIHTLERPYTCPYDVCNKRFARSDNLSQHIRVHRASKRILTRM
ncbi:hypothetical protein BDF14DRAFT_773495 [Spinellus fusiger]|nr:hypothetical protein BDF14DRAFT_773495 [Spinellus fusiger]